MSESIWHTADEIPDFNKSYVELSRSLQGDLVYSTWGHPNYITPNTIKWCYMDDLLALETKLERTRKALDAALNAMESAKEHNIINCVARGVDPKDDDVNITLWKALEQITALEQKDKRCVAK